MPYPSEEQIDRGNCDKLHQLYFPFNARVGWHSVFKFPSSLASSALPEIVESEINSLSLIGGVYLRTPCSYSVSFKYKIK